MWLGIRGAHHTRYLETISLASLLLAHIVCHIDLSLASSSCVTKRGRSYPFYTQCPCLRSWQRKTRCPQKKVLVARVFPLQKQVIYQIKAKRVNYLIKDFISSNFKRCLSFLLLNSEVSSLLLKLQPFRVVKYSLPFYCV